LAKPPSPSFEQNRDMGGGGIDRAAGPSGVGDWRRPGVGGARGIGENGEEDAATYSGSHLGWGRPVEVAPRRGTGGGGAKGGGGGA
jgi:hypothetical protein